MSAYGHIGCSWVNKDLNVLSFSYATGLPSSVCVLDCAFK